MAPADSARNAIGAALRDLGWSHSRLMVELRQQARQEGVTLPTTPSLAANVSRWVNNHLQPNEFYRVLLSRAIGKPRAELFGDEAAAFTVQGPSELAIARAVDRLAPDTLRATSPSTHELLAWLGGLVDTLASGEGNMKRREFVSQLAAFLAGLGLDEAATKRDPAEYVGHALAGSAKLDAATLDDMAVVTARYRRAYRGLSVRKLLPQARGHLVILEDLRHASATPEQRRLLAITTGEAEALIGVMRLMDLYQFDEAWRHFDRALVAARETDAAELEAFVLGSVAFNACYGGDRGEAGQLSALARNVVTKVDAPVTAGWLAAVDAEIQARAGNESGCLAALDHAEASLAKVGKDSAAWIGVGSFDTAKLAGYYGACYQLLGRPQEALAELQKALGALEPTMLKHRCNAMADVALALSQLDEPGESYRYASEALSVAVGLRHAGTIDRVRSVQRRLEPWRRDPALREAAADLEERLRLAS